MHIVLKCSWQNAILPGAFKNNGLCKIWGANRVYYGELENREWSSVEHFVLKRALQYRVLENGENGAGFQLGIYLAILGLFYEFEG